MQGKHWTALAVLLAIGLAIAPVAPAQDIEVEEQEWYDPSDWFDDSPDVEYDWWEDEYEYEYDDDWGDDDGYDYDDDWGYDYGYDYDDDWGYNYGYDYDYWTDDWYDDEGVWENWWED